MKKFIQDAISSVLTDTWLEQKTPLPSVVPHENLVLSINCTHHQCEVFRSKAQTPVTEMFKTSKTLWLFEHFTRCDNKKNHARALRPLICSLLRSWKTCGRTKDPDNGDSELWAKHSLGRSQRAELWKWQHSRERYATDDGEEDDTNITSVLIYTYIHSYTSTDKHT